MGFRETNLAIVWGPHIVRDSREWVIICYNVNIPLARFKEKGLLPSLNLGVHRTLSSKPDSSLAV